VTRFAPYKAGDTITVTHDTEAGQRVTEPVTVRRVVALTDGQTWRVETDRHDGGVMHLYVDRAGVIAVGELTRTKTGARLRSRNTAHGGNRSTPFSGVATRLDRGEVPAPLLIEGQLRCPVCRKGVRPTERGYLRRHRDLFGHDCHNVAVEADLTRT